MSWLDFSEGCETDSGSPVDSWGAPSSDAAYPYAVSKGSWHVSLMREESRPEKSSSTCRQSPRSEVLSALRKMTKRPSPASPPTISRQDDVYTVVNGSIEPRNTNASDTSNIKFVFDCGEGSGEESDWSSSKRYPCVPLGAECDIHLDTDNPLSSLIAGSFPRDITPPRSSDHSLYASPSSSALLHPFNYLEYLLQEVLASSASDENSCILPNTASLLRKSLSTARTSANTERATRKERNEKNGVKRSQESYIAPSLTAVLASGTNANALLHSHSSLSGCSSCHTVCSGSFLPLSPGNALSSRPATLINSLAEALPSKSSDENKNNGSTSESFTNTRPPCPSLPRISTDVDLTSSLEPCSSSNITDANDRSKAHTAPSTIFPASYILFDDSVVHLPTTVAFSTSLSSLKTPEAFSHSHGSLAQGTKFLQGEECVTEMRSASPCQPADNSGASAATSPSQPSEPVHGAMDASSPAEPLKSWLQLSSQTISNGQTSNSPIPSPRSHSGNELSDENQPHLKSRWSVSVTSDNGDSDNEIEYERQSVWSRLGSPFTRAFFKSHTTSASVDQFDNQALNDTPSLQDHSDQTVPANADPPASVRETPSPQLGTDGHGQKPSPSPPKSDSGMATQSLHATLELLLTEHTYLTSLRLLLVQDRTRPPLMVHRAWALVRASEAFLWKVEELISRAETEGAGVADGPDGNAEHIGVSLVAQAFIDLHRRVEKAMVDWSRVVGSFFVGPDEKAAPSPASVSAILDRMKVKTKCANQKKSWRTGTSEPTSPSASVSRFKVSHVRSKSGDQELQSSSFKGKPSVRELAILPTQRVTRYVLLFEGLLAFTSEGSRSHTLVKRALDAAQAMASKCDEAQQNAAFLIN